MNLITYLGDRHDDRFAIVSTILVEPYNVDHVTPGMYESFSVLNTI